MMYHCSMPESPLDPTDVRLAATPSQRHAEQRYPEVTRLSHDVVDGHLLVGDGTALGVERRQEDEVKGRR